MAAVMHSPPSPQAAPTPEQPQKKHAAQHHPFCAVGIGRLAGITACQNGGEKLDADQHIAEAAIMADIKR
jgi:hypothetical protein